MTDFGIDVDDTAVKAALKELKEDFSDSPVYIVSADAEYAIYVEMGTRDMPPYPFFRPALREFKANPETFLIKNTELGGLGDIESTEELVETVALALEAQIKVNATAQAPDRSPGTAPEHPQVQTGNLRARISAKRVG